MTESYYLLVQNYNIKELERNLGLFKVLDESCFISLLHYQEMPDLEVIINYGRRVNTHLPLFQDWKKKKKNFTIGVQLLGCHGHGILFVSFVEQLTVSSD